MTIARVIVYCRLRVTSQWPVSTRRGQLHAAGQPGLSVADNDAYLEWEIRRTVALLYELSYWASLPSVIIDRVYMERSLYFALENGNAENN